LAEQARVAAARRFAREKSAIADQSISVTPEADADSAEPGWRERTRLNFLNSYYRSTLFGALRLASLAHLASTPGEPGISPEFKRAQDDLRDEYRQVVADLARYDRMRSAGSAGEFGAAALGGLGGAMLSPESWLGLGARGATWLARAGKAGLQQGAINSVADLGVQGLNMEAGVQDRIDWSRPIIAAGTGFAGGATLHSLAETLSPSRFFDPRLTRREQFEVNRNVGRVYEEQFADQLRQMGMRDVSSQITLKPAIGPPVRIDFMARDPHTGNIRCFECKSSDTAPLSQDQRISFPEIELGGARIMGAGKPAFPGGTLIPPTKVEVWRP
jgi:hypothetical protein